MRKYQLLIFLLLIIAFLLFSFYPTIFELSKSNKLADSRREFILEHNYYWPDYNLYLSKIKQGIEGRFTAVEKYTSEIHHGSLIQEFYVVLGWGGAVLNLSPNNSYLLGRIIFSPLLLLVIILLINHYFRSFIWQIIAFLITISSGSFPRIYQDPQGMTHIGRFMEWWSNIDALQRITFIPHILFGQVVSFYLLYQITHNRQQITNKKIIIYIILGNLVGLTFPPSLITLNTVLLLILFIKTFKKIKSTLLLKTGGSREGFPNVASLALSTTKWSDFEAKFGILARQDPLIKIFMILSLPSILYIFLITKHLPWSALVDFHRTHPMMIPFDQYILGTGPIFFLGLAGAIVSIIKRDNKFQTLIFWILATFGFAAVFSVVKDQSPLRFTQTGLFIPLGILGSYFFYQIFLIRPIRLISLIGISLYIIGSLFMMKVSLDWQTTWISQRIGANIPPVPYPPQAMYPLKEWMDGIRWLRDNTNHEDAVLAEITAANHIPAYAGNTVYWGQSNTVNYDRKEKEVDQFFRGQMTPEHAQLFLKNGRIKYIFFSIQEKDKSGGKKLEDTYSFLIPKYSNNLVVIYHY